MSAQLKLGALGASAVSRRGFLRFAALGAAGAVLAACAPKAAPATEAPAEEPAVESTPAPAEAKQVMVFECCWNEAHINAGTELYAGFQTEHPELTLNVYWNPPGEDWTAKLLAQVAAGDPIDVIWWCASHHKFAEEGRLLDLTELMNADASFSLDDYQPVGVDFCYDKPNRQGALWGVPTNYATVLLWYNMKMFDEAGLDYPTADWTYDDLLETALALTKDTNGDGTNDVFGVKVASAGGDHWYYQPVMEAFGGGIVEVDSEPACLINKPESIEALQWLQDLQYKHKVAPTAADMAGLGEQAMMISDKLAMGFWPEWATFEFLPAHADAGFNFGVQLLPTGPKGRVTDYWAGITSVMSRTTAPQEAWDTAKFISGEKYQTKMTVDLPESPAAMISVAEYRFKEYEKYPDERSAYLESPKYGTQYFNIARYGKEMGDIVTPAMDTVWEGAVAPAEVVDEICTKIDAKLAELRAG